MTVLSLLILIYDVVLYTIGKVLHYLWFIFTHSMHRLYGNFTHFMLRLRSNIRFFVVEHIVSIDNIHFCILCVPIDTFWEYFGILIVHIINLNINLIINWCNKCTSCMVDCKPIVNLSLLSIVNICKVYHSYGYCLPL